MAIVLGTATISGEQVVIQPPVGGFQGIEAVRLSNYTGDALILTNIQSDRPGQEYLLPFQQNVYKQINDKEPPAITAVVLGTTFSTEALLVEWSTDALGDFPGTYPQNLAQAALTGGLAAPAWEAHDLAIPDDGTTTTIPADPRRVSFTFIVIGTNPIQFSQFDSLWGSRPIAQSGSSRTIDSTAAFFFRGAGDGDSEIQWLETRFGTIVD